MFVTSAATPTPVPFAALPVQVADLNATLHQQQQQQQQQLHYNLFNLNAAATSGLVAPSQMVSSNGNNAPNGSQSSSQVTSSHPNEPSQQQQVQSQQQQQQQQQQLSSNGISFPSPNYPPLQQILLENLYNNVLLREKSPNVLYDPRKTRKRMSDPVYVQQQPLQPLVLNQQQTNIHAQLQQQQQQQLPTLNLQRVQSGHSLNRRRSIRFSKPPIILEPIAQQPTREPQKMFVVRHAERVDSTFGSNWLDQVFDKTTGLYRRINLNLPKKMVTRRDLKDFLFDPPLTELGLHECKMVGEELAAQGIKISHVYASPALRCVQTADKILEGLQLRDEISIRIEPCLFEFLKWYPVVPVKWPFLALDELTRNGYKVDMSYKPFYPIESLRKDEDELMYYTRSHFIVTSILKNHELDGGNLLIVGHAPTIEVCTRQLTGGQPRVNDLKFLVLRVPFLSMHCLAKQIDGTWRATKSPVAPIKHAAVEPFDWRFFR